MRRALRIANRFGIVTLQDASAWENSLRAYTALDRRGELTERVASAVRINPDKGDAQLPALIRIREQYKSPRLSAGAVKILADGVIEAHTAVLLAPYLDRAGHEFTHLLGADNTYNRVDVSFSPKMTDLQSVATYGRAASFDFHHALGRLSTIIVSKAVNTKATETAWKRDHSLDSVYDPTSPERRAEL